MANITDTDGWVAVTRPETSDIALGGNETNFPGSPFRELASRDQYLKTEIETLGGSDAASKATAASFRQMGYASVAQGRLTLATGNATPTSDITAATTLYYTPYNGDQVAIWDGSQWQIKTFAEISLSLAGLAAGTNYDIFLYDDSGTLTLQAIGWTNSGAGTSARAQAISRRNGTWVKTSDDRRYLGTIRMTGVVGQCEDSITSRFVFNAQNQREQFMFKNAPQTIWTYDGLVYRPLNNDQTMKADLVLGLSQLIEVTFYLNVANSGSLVPNLGIGVNSSSSDSALIRNNGVGLGIGNDTGTYCFYTGYPPIGFCQVWMLEANEGVGPTPEFVGSYTPGVQVGQFLRFQG